MEAHFHLLLVILDILLLCKICLLSHLHEGQILFFHAQNLKMVSEALSLVLGICQIWGFSQKGMERPITAVSLDGQGSPDHRHDCKSGELALIWNLVAALNWECGNPWLHLGQQGMQQEYFAAYSLREEISSVSGWVQELFNKAYKCGIIWSGC